MCATTKHSLDDVNLAQKKKMAHWKIFKCNLLREEKGKKEDKNLSQILHHSNILTRKNKENRKRKQRSGLKVKIIKLLLKKGFNEFASWQFEKRPNCCSGS